MFSNCNVLSYFPQNILKHDAQLEGFYLKVNIKLLPFSSEDNLNVTIEVIVVDVQSLLIKKLGNMNFDGKNKTWNVFGELQWKRKKRINYAVET